MKKREDMEWKLFELLEGELSVSEEAEILAQMEEDESLEEEWALLQSTRLTAPEVSYTNKKSLLKKETTVLAFTGMKWLKYAAILAVVAGTYPLWKTAIFSDDVEGLVGSASEIVEPNHVAKTIEPEPTADIPQEEIQSSEVAESITPQRVDVEPVREYSAPQNNPDPLSRHSHTGLVKTLQPLGYVIVPAKSEVNNLTVQREYAAQDFVPVQFSPEWFAQMDVGDVTAEEENNTLKYRGIRPALNSGLAWIASPFRNSKVSVKPVPGNFKALQFTYSNSQYEATAMVSLTPIKD
jgi:hypothetical protein